MARGKGLLPLPRAVAIRSFLFNHLYHHRGQVLGATSGCWTCRVPSVYGPTANENPFAGAMRRPPAGHAATQRLSIVRTSSCAMS